MLLLTHFNDMGAGGRLHVEYGPTAAYGMQLRDGYARPKLGEEGAKFSLPFLAPSTLYHFRVTITTPFGTATSPDQTVTTKALESPAPTIVNGTPRVAGEHAASLSATIDPQGNQRLLLRADRTRRAGRPVEPAGPLAPIPWWAKGGRRPP